VSGAGLLARLEAGEVVRTTMGLLRVRRCRLERAAVDLPSDHEAHPELALVVWVECRATVTELLQLSPDALPW
jgi:hypothetical protein